MSCERPQVSPIIPDYGRLSGQHCSDYLDGSPAGRPTGADALLVSGSRSGRVVTNPIKFKSLCDDAGVSEDGKLYVWAGGAADAMLARHFYIGGFDYADYKNIFKSERRNFGDFIGPRTHVWPEGVASNRGLFQVGEDTDWESVSSDAGRILAIKEDGSLWSLGDWQVGVDMFSSKMPAPVPTRINAGAFRAKLSSSIVEFRTEPLTIRERLGDVRDPSFHFLWPVWFTAAPSSPLVEKLKYNAIEGGPFVAQAALVKNEGVSVAGQEPGTGATASIKYLAKIDIGAIRGGVVGSFSSPITFAGNSDVEFEGFEGSGGGAAAKLRVIEGEVELTVTEPGQGYKHPVVARLSNGVTFQPAKPRGILITSGGSGYTSVPQVVIKPSPQEPEPVEGVATARVSKMSKVAVGSFLVGSAGSGYTAATATERKTGATATAVLTPSGSISGWNMSSAGSATHTLLDSEPLVVDVFGDGTGATATAVPATSSVEDIEIVSNPEIWTVKPLIEILGGGGQGASAVVEGIIGRVAVSVVNGGSGYTATKMNPIRGLFSEGNRIYDDFGSNIYQQAKFMPCVTVSPQGLEYVGGRLVQGRIIVAEAVLSPSPVVQIEEDPAEFLGNNAYPRNVGVVPIPLSDTKADRLHRHRSVIARLTVAAPGTLHPFEIDGPGLGPPFPGVRPTTARAYARGPGHSRHPLQLELVGNEPHVVPRVSLNTKWETDQPPAICIEYDSPEHGSDMQFSAVERVVGAPATLFGPAENPVAIFGIDFGFPALGGALFRGGAMTATGPRGASRTDRIVDGRFQIVDGRFQLPDNKFVTAPYDSDLEDLPATITGAIPYVGPIGETVIADPASTWRPPTDAQRVHFIFGAVHGTPARGLATAVYDPNLRHPVLSTIEVVEPGSGYTSEPVPDIFDAIDPFPVRTGLDNCTSAGFVKSKTLKGDSELQATTPYAYANGEMYWWGEQSAIRINVDSVLPQTVPPTDAVGYPIDIAEHYLFGFKLKTPSAVNRPNLVGGHLRFSVSGLHASDDQYGTVRFLRMPRPDIGNRLASPEPSSSTPGGVGPIAFSPSNSIAFISWPDSSYLQQQSAGSRRIAELMYLPRQVTPLDHGIGYLTAEQPVYVGPGLGLTTFNLSLEMIPNGLVHVGRGGLLRDNLQRWRGSPQDFSLIDGRDFPRFAYSPVFRDRTVTYATTYLAGADRLEDGVRFPTGYLVTTVDGQEWSDLTSYEVVTRKAGSGYNPSQESGDNPSLSVSGSQDVGRVDAEFLGPTGADASITRVTLTREEVISTREVGLSISTHGGVKNGVLLEDWFKNPVGTVINAGSGTGFEFEIVEQDFYRRRTPFPVVIYDPVSAFIEPLDCGVAVTPDANLRTFSDGRLRLPEALAELDSKEFTSLSLCSIQYPYFANGRTSFAARDSDGILWTAGIGPLNFPQLIFLSNPYVDHNVIDGESHQPLVVAPIAISTTDIGGGYDYPVRVDISQPPGVAAGTVAIDGKVVAVGVVEPGSGYESPPTVVMEDAMATARISGPVHSVTLTSEGSGYRLPPKVVFSSPGRGAEATTQITDGKVTAIQLSAGGAYRAPPQVSFEPVKDVESVSITNGGQGYSTAPTVHIEGLATATAEIDAQVTLIEVVLAGAGYTTTPVVEITGGGGQGATARAVLNPANGQIALIEVINGGSGYTSVPTVAITGGGGSGAIADATIEGPVSAINLTSRGRDYDRPPRVVFTGGGGTGAEATAVLGSPGGGAAATARIDGSVIAVTVTSSGNQFQKPPLVSTTRGSVATGGPTQVDAVLKAVILGRPTSVSITKPGSRYYTPDFGQRPRSEFPDEGERRHPTRLVRRELVAAKGSFYMTNHDPEGGSHSRFNSPIAKRRGDEFFGKSVFSKQGQGFHYWLNTHSVLGFAELEGGNSPAGGFVKSVQLFDKSLIGVQVTNPGSGYPPFSEMTINISGGSQSNEFNLRRASSSFTNPGSLASYEIRAYAGADGKIYGASLRSDLNWPTYWSQPPTLTIYSPFGGSGATFEPILGHPLECYYSPQVHFDGCVEVEADMSLTVAGIGVEGGTLPYQYYGAGPDYPYLVNAVTVNFQPTRLAMATLNRYERLSGQVSVAGKIKGLVILEPDWPRSPFTDEENTLREKTVGFFSTPPEIYFEDARGTGVLLTPKELPSNGAVSGLDWVEWATVEDGGSGYTLGSRLRLRGGRPLAWDNPAEATVTLSGGSVASVTVQNGGKGHTIHPRVMIVGDGDGATAVVHSVSPEEGEVMSVRVTHGGQGYTTARVVFLDQETVAEKNEAIAELLALYDKHSSVLLEEAEIDSVLIPPSQRRKRTTVAVRESLRSLEPGFPGELAPLEWPFDVPFAGIGSGIGPDPSRRAFTGGLLAAGTRFHSVFLSDGTVEYVRLENHFGEPMPDPCEVSFSPNSDVQPCVAATAVAVIPECDNVFSGTVANVTTDFPPYQLQAASLPLVFDLDNDSTYSGDIAGVGNVIKRGAGTLTLTGRATFAGTLVIQGGAVVVKSLPSAADITLSGGDVVFDMESSGTFFGEISGNGSVIKKGNGGLVLTQSPDITGKMRIDKGNIAGVTLTVSGEFWVAAGASLNADIVLDDGELNFDATTLVSYSGQITGNGTVIKQGGGELTFSGSADFEGEFRLEEGSLGGSITVGEGTSLKVTRGTIAAIVSLDEGRVVFAESGVANHAGTISGSGEAIINGGVSLTLVGHGIPVEGSVALRVAGTMIVKDDFQLTKSVVLSGGELIFNIDNAASYSNAITGYGSVSKQGEGVLNFSGAAIFSGEFDVNNGRLDGNILVGDSTSLNVYDTLSANVVLDGGTLAFFSGEPGYDGAVSGSGAVEVSSELFSLTGRFNFNGETTVKQSSLVIVDGAAITSDIRLESGELVFSLEGGYTYEGSISGAGTVRKAGEGALTLSSRSTFLGLVDINGGSLEVLKEAAFDAPLPFASATFTPTTLTVNFSQAPVVGSDYLIFVAETYPSYPNDSLILTGTTASGNHSSLPSRVVIVS